MTNTTTHQPNPLATRLVARIADERARRRVFEDYRERKAPNTVRRQVAALRLFSRYLTEAGLSPGDLAEDVDAWAGLTWGLVEGFRQWLLEAGYAVGSVNVRLSTIRTYATLATQAGALAPEQLILIKAVRGYARREAKHLDEKRQQAETATRRGHKAAEPRLLNKQQAQLLKREHPPTPQGRRDRLLLCLLLDHGLRCSEVAGLQVSDFDLSTGEMKFYRPKVDKVQTHELSQAARRAAAAYFKYDALPLGPLLRASRKGNGGLTTAGLSERAISARVEALGRRILGLEGLSAHDLRHTWATLAARAGTPLDRLQDAGGWSSPAMPLRYIEAAKIANQGVRLE